jgi:hypothetical protein
MKRSTIILLLVAAIGGVLVYYLEFKDAKPRDEQPEATKPAFTFKREDLASVSLTRNKETVVLEQQDAKWVIKQPVNAPANDSAVDTLISDLSGARIERTITPSNEEIKSFGRAEPATDIKLKLKNGTEHRIRIGSKDFTNLSVYAIIDQSRDVALLPATIATSAEKSLNDLRDLAIFGGLSQFDISQSRTRMAASLWQRKTRFGCSRAQIKRQRMRLRSLPC